MTALSLAEWGEGSVAAAAEIVVAVAWEGDPLPVAAVAADEPNQTKLVGANELNQTKLIGVIELNQTKPNS